MRNIKTITTVLGMFSAMMFSQEFTTSVTASKNNGFPKVDTKGHALFRVHFPKANSVILEGGDGMKNIKSTTIKEQDGFWEISAEGMEIGFHYYWFNVDGQRTNDPNSQLYFGYGQPTSGIEIPSGEDFFQEKNVRRGKIVNDSIYSKITESKRNLKIYLPPGYRTKKSPVLYLYHGTGEDITGWVKQGYINNILDNLFAEKKAREMIVVMDYGIALSSAEEKLPDNYERTVISTKNLDKIMVDELIPYIETKYKTNGKRAIAGLSRGSYQAMYIGAAHPELFSAVGSFSPVIYEGTPDHPFKELPLDNVLKSKQKPLFFIGIGEKEDARFVEFNQTIVSYLYKNKYPYLQYTSPSTYHEWLTWRRCLYQFAQKIFK